MGMIMEDSDLMGRMRKYKLELIKRSNKSEESIIFFQLFNFHIDERERERGIGTLQFHPFFFFFNILCPPMYIWNNRTKWIKPNVRTLNSSFSTVLFRRR